MASPIMINTAAAMKSSKLQHPVTKKNIIPSAPVKYDNFFINAPTFKSDTTMTRTFR